MCGMPYMAPLLKTPDGVDLACYLLPQTSISLASSYKVPRNGVVDERVELTEAAAKARATVIVFHGNSMHNYEDFGTARHLYKMKCNVFLLSYRGYGFSGGKPSEAGLRIDAQTALDYILSQPYLAHVPVILYGHSLGGGVAIDLASRNPSRIAAVLVSNTFTSIPDIVRTWPIIGPFSFICTQKWRSIDKLRSIPISTPILMISGRQDEVIPPQLMDKLWQAAQKRGITRNSLFHWPILRSAEEDIAPASESLPEHDEFVTVAHGTHNSTPSSRTYWRAIKKFVEMVGAQTEDRPHPVQADVTTRIPDRRWFYHYPNLMVQNSPDA
ncbi:hypothetical protein C0995_002412 [Termitomyces sp. Mi166|nr:hypothetical protein C0995_002412 [Termitomyces sp. Mi166\